MTPVIKESIRHPRFHEIQQYLNENNIKEDWIAIDDMAVLFPPNCENLFLIDAREAFSKKYVKKLIELIDTYIENSKEKKSKIKP